MLYSGYTYAASLNYNGEEITGTPAITMTLAYNTISGYAPQDVPTVFPYGFLSVPDDNQACIYSGSGGFFASCVLGYFNNIPQNSNMQSLQKGESGIFSKGNFTLQAKLNALQTIFTNSSQEVVNSPLPIGVNVTQILIDLIAEIKALETNYNTLIDAVNSISTTITTAVNPGSGVPLVAPADPPPIAPYAPTGNFTQDDTFLGSSSNPTSSKNYTNSIGELAPTVS